MHIRQLQIYDKVFLFFYTFTQLALQLHQERIQVLRSSSETQKRPAESNNTPAMDLGFEVIRTTTSRIGCFCKIHDVISYKKSKSCASNAKSGLAVAKLKSLPTVSPQSLTDTHTLAFFNQPSLLTCFLRCQTALSPQH